MPNTFFPALGIAIWGFDGGAKAPISTTKKNQSEAKEADLESRYPWAAWLVKLEKLHFGS